jgi:hypothetical protein
MTRRLVTAKEVLDPLMEEIGQRARGPGSVYLVGGASAVWFGWRASTVDVDLALAPEPAGLFGAIEQLKRELGINIELAAPSDFVPPLPGWQARSEFIRRVGLVDFYHYDFYTQAFAKMSRGHTRDRQDIAAMAAHGKVDAGRLVMLVEQVAGEIKRYPNLNAAALLSRVRGWSYGPENA